MINLENYGFTNFFTEQTNELTASAQTPLEPARITAVQREFFTAVCAEGEVLAKPSGHFSQDAYLQSTRQTRENIAFPTVGDFVLLRPNPGGAWMIEQVLRRKSKFGRANHLGHKQGYVQGVLEQVVAANFDTVVILTSMNMDFSPARIERYVTAAWDSGAVPVVILSKADLCTEPESYIDAAKAAAPGVDVFAVSALTGQGLEQLAPYTLPGQTLVFLGSSGVGKSSLLNALAGEEVMATGSIREDDARGRHTTTHRQLQYLPGGCMIIDTPGMRELGLWTASTGLDESFSDITQLAAACRFGDCHHESEPGCAIQAALENGTLDAARWKNYLKLQKEIRNAQRKTAHRNLQNKKSKKKSRYIPAYDEE